MANYLGIDVGGTKTDAIIANHLGEVLALASNGGANWESIGFSDAVASISALVSEALHQANLRAEDISEATFAMAGVDWESDAEMFRAELSKIGLANISILNDSFAALFAGTPSGEGCVSICGTGGKTSGQHNGKLLQTLGVLAGEAGGALQLVESLQSALVSAYNGRTEKSPLYFDLIGAFKFSTEEKFFHALIRGHLRLQTTLAPVIFEAADAGDEIAQAITSQLARDHVADLVAISGRLGIDGRFTIVRAGGLHTAGSTYFDNAFNSEVKRALPKAEIVVLETIPAVGALIHAMGPVGTEVSGRIKDGVERLAK